jgi:Ca2+-binding EF-hand superfamily protein
MVDTGPYEATFRIVDVDGDGLITAEEMRSVMRALGDEVTAARADTIVKAIDSDGDGRISLDEFARFMTDP